jgi:riboflavin synthase
VIPCPVALVICLVMLACVTAFVLWAVVDVARHHDERHADDLERIAEQRRRDHPSQR